MPFPKDPIVAHTDHTAGRPASPPHGYAQDTAGWQALYETMLRHLTGNVEVWLQSYLAEMMAAGRSPGEAGRGRSPGSKSEVRVAMPPWLEPFSDPDNVRFTRTPDHILLRERGIVPKGDPSNDDALAAVPAPAPAAEPPLEAAVPPERRPFVLPPNVRYTRTPDRPAARPEPVPVVEAGAMSAADTAIAADAAPAADAARQADLVRQAEAGASPTMLVRPGLAGAEVPLDVLIAETYAGALASDPFLAGAFDAEYFEGWHWAPEPDQPTVAASEVPPVWTRMIQPVPPFPPRVATEQDNAPEALASFLTLEPLALEASAVAHPIAPEPEPEPIAIEDASIEPAWLRKDEWAAYADAFDKAIDVDMEPADEGFAPERDDAPGEGEAGLDPGEAAASEAAASEAATGEAAASEAEIPVPAPIAAEIQPPPASATPPLAAISAEIVRAAPVSALQLSMMGSLHQTGKPARRPRFSGVYEHPPLDLLAEPARQTGTTVTRDALEQHARLLEGVLEDFGIRGEIINVRPGPVVTLYELEPAPGIKSSRVVGLADDIARSMSAISARVAVVQGRNVIGIELPNEHRDTVYLRELLDQADFGQSKHKLAIALGKTIGGEPVIVDLARMPHLLVAGTTGSGKSVAINTMILSLLYRLKPEECRLIMVDPKMLELSIYDGIPHLLTPVVTDPKKAVVALKWAVREMEDRYKKMSKVGVRNIDGFNVRVAEAKAKGETIVRSVHTGFDRQTGQATYAQEEMDLTVLPYIVVIVDEMADLMMVAGKDIEGAIQRLAQMARAAGIHLIMATQRPSVDVITGTIKANFPTRISFQVTSKIDSRTILGEQGAEQLLGQGDMLHMMGGGRIARVHGPFVSDHEVELVVAHLKAQGQPDYLDVTTEEGEPGEAAADEDGGEDGAVFDKSAMAAGASGEDAELYDQAVKIVLRDKKCSTSYIQRRLSVGYNKAASLVERMEKEGIVGPSNHAGKREILIYSRDFRTINIDMREEDEDA